MFRDEALYEQVFGFNSSSQEVEANIPALFCHLLSRKGHRHGVVIGHHKVAIIVLLQTDPVFNGTKIASEVEFARWLNAGEDGLILAHGAKVVNSQVVM